MLVLFSSLLLILVVLTVVPSEVGTCLVHSSGCHNSMPNNRLGTALYNTQYSDNWAGAVWTADNNTFNSVTGKFTVPTPSGSTGAAAAAWVGIDGDTCASAILQTGVVFIVEDNGPAYFAWYEWFPAPSYNFSGISISAGDVVQLTVTAHSATSGVAMIDNLTNGQTVSQALTSPVPLCGQNAEWVVEDYMQGSGDLVNFVDFGAVTFTSAMATGAANYTPSGAIIFDIKQKDKILTSTSSNGSSVTITYV